MLGKPHATLIFINDTLGQDNDTSGRCFDTLGQTHPMLGMHYTTIILINATIIWYTPYVSIVHRNAKTSIRFRKDEPTASLK